MTLGLAAARIFSMASLLDLGARVLALLGQSAPVYWLGLMLILIFGVQLGWFPVSGIGGVRHLILPAITLGLFSMAKIMRLTRSAMLDILQSDFLRTARAKGVQPLRLITHHALRNAWIPIVTVIGIELGTLLSQAIITETVFSWPGSDGSPCRRSTIATIPSWKSSC